MQPRHLSGFGLVERRLGDCVERLSGAKLARRSVLEPRGWVSRDDAVAYLSHLTWPATRLALFGVNERWTAVVTNGRDGSDFADHQLFVGELCDARTCRVLDREPRRGIANGYRFRQGYAARAFELHDAQGRNLRSIHALDDGGRWEFAAWGDDVLPVEASFDYGARRKGDRFTSANLQAVLASLGFARPVPEAFERADRHFLLYERMRHAPWARDIEARALTVEEADNPGVAYLERGLGWVPRMATHAQSVVSDLTKAALLDPTLRDRVDPHLRSARRRLGEAECERIAAEAEVELRRRGG